MAAPHPSTDYEESNDVRRWLRVDGRFIWDILCTSFQRPKPGDLSFLKRTVIAAFGYVLACLPYHCTSFFRFFFYPRTRHSRIIDSASNIKPKSIADLKIDLYILPSFEWPNFIVCFLLNARDDWKNASALLFIHFQIRNSKNMATSLWVYYNPSCTNV